MRLQQPAVCTPPAMSPTRTARTLLSMSSRLLHTSLACPVAPAAAGGQRAPDLTPRRLRRLVKMQARKNEDTSPYRSTVCLPTTTFDMRANSLTREPQIQQWWQEQGVYEQLSQDDAREPFTLHDGPPYANGDVHMGHALNKVLKDIVNRYQLLQGRKARYVPGWDCHGLPIELKVLQSMSEEQREGLTSIKLRRKARDFALKTVEKQKEQFKRWGVWGDWEAPYLTLNPAYEAAQLSVFGRMVLNGHIYRGRKPVHWSPSSGTALAEAELEYPEAHMSRSIYVAMPLVATGQGAGDAAVEALQGSAFAIWTTTPWTIPANLAVAVNDQLEYSVVEASGEAAVGWSHKKLVVATDLVSALQDKLGVTLRVLCTVSGAALEGCSYRHPLVDRMSPVVVGGDYITTESGTGLVHTAPGHGQEDYLVGQRYGLPLLSPVDDEGVFTAEAGAFAGLPVLGAGNTAVIEALQEQGVLLLEEAYGHKYPYDWRTKKPTIFRATDQWFASVEGFRDAALQAIREVTWIPATGENRITAMTEGRSDWCISRQRKWGVPIPVFYYKDSGEPLMTEETIQHITEVVHSKGSDAWWLMDVEELLPETLRDQAPLLKKGEDTMDVWFDSGSSWAGVVQAGGLSFPADLYLEGSDQHRGWFQSSLLTSVAASGTPPYRRVLTHGFVLDERGTKMSKSLGNVMDPRDVVLGGKDQKKQPALGADVMRLWVSSVDYTSDVMIGERILSQVSDVYRKLRFTIRFLLGNLSDFDPAAHAVSLDALPAVDRYTLGRLAALIEDVTAAYEQYQFYRVYQMLQRFAVSDLSQFYLDVVKDRLYIAAPDSPDRRACQTVLAHLLQTLLPLMAPVLPHMAEDAWQALPYAKPTASVFEAGWPAPQAAWKQAVDADAPWNALLQLRTEVNGVLEKARVGKALGASLEAKVLLHVGDEALRRRLAALQAAGNGADPLRFLFIVSQAELVGSADEVAAACSEYYANAEIEGVGESAVTVKICVTTADGSKCARCWNYSAHVGHAADHPELCERCAPVMPLIGFELPEKVPA